MLTIRSLVVLGLLWATADASPQSRKKGGNGRAKTAQQQAALIPQGVSKATDGSTILDTTVTINGLDIRYKISGPPAGFTPESGVPGGAAAAGTPGTMGLNVLLHGDGGQSFFDFPNQAVQKNLMGVAVLAPNKNLFWGGGSGLQRTDGVAHAQAVADLVTKVLPGIAAFNASDVSFTGVSGGSLLLSGFFVPAHAAQFQGSSGGVLLNCGGLAPQVDVAAADAAAIAKTRIHFQSTQQELSSLQPAIPQAIAAYEKLASGAGAAADQIGALQTVDNSPNGGHCEFDEKDFVSGVQLMADSFSAIMQGGNGQVAGKNVLNPVVGKEKLSFKAGNRRSMAAALRV
ncbi:uncharacterized protein PG986_002984 [Apiospora aurea]|uniref:Cyclin-like f-box protein n=1 Tax=Apiospora aurea TaxID=335848 RepID=A0ABR1QQY9_9PEZI